MTVRDLSAEMYESNFSFSVDADRGRVERNRARLAGELGFAPERLAVNRQVHGVDVIAVDREYRECEGDGLITNQRGWLLGVSVADCGPVLLYDRETGAIGAIHSGWRGSAAGVVGNGIVRMREEYDTDPGDLLVWLGPSAGPCCYEVGDEVADRFDRSCSRPTGEGKYLFDNRRAILLDLLREGVPAASIHVDSRCTICDSSFHSWRRDGPDSGRMLAVIGRREVHPE
jgi:hypothetical protein